MGSNPGRTYSQGHKISEENVLPNCSSIYRTELLKSKLPLMSLFLCDENHVACYAILAARYENHVA